jgi:hypothetical protein
MQEPAMSPVPRDHPFTRVIGVGLAIIFAISCLIASVFSVPHTITGYIVVTYAVAAAVPMAELYVAHLYKNQMELLRITLSRSEKQLLQAHRLFFASPITASNFAHLLDLTRWFGMVWAGLALWTGAYGPALLIAAFYLIAGWLVARLSPITRYQAAAHRGDRAAQNRLAMICHIDWNRYSAFGLRPPFRRSPADEGDR